MVKVVIVDDHALVREAWSMMLSRDDRLTIIEQCSDGEEAVETVKRISPDVVLMDINMEPMNGLQATKAIRQFDFNVKIIGISIHTEPAYVKGLILSGANGYVTKNSSVTEMIEAIFTVMEGREYICKEISVGMEKGR